MNFPAPAIPSPCIKVCILDEHGVCTGCGRRIEEIAGWTGMTAEEQRRVCEAAANRRKATPTR